MSKENTGKEVAPKRIDIRKNFDRIGLTMAHTMDQLEKFLKKGAETKKEVQEFLDLKLSGSIPFLDRVFRKKWHVLVHLPEGSDEFQIDLSTEQLGFLRTTGEVKGDNFVEILNSYYDWLLKNAAKEMNKSYERVTDKDGKFTLKKRKATTHSKKRKSPAKRNKKSSRRKK